MTDNLRGALWMLLAMAGFAVEDMLFKLITRDISPGFALAIFGLSGMVLFAALSRRAGEPVLHPQTFRPRLLLRSGFEIAGRLFFALALAYTPLSSTAAILQASPLVVTFGAALFLGEKVGMRRWTAMAMGLAGVLLILKPTPEAFRLDALLALAAMIGFSGRDLATRAAPQGVSRWQLGTLGFAVLLIAGTILMLTTGVPGHLPQPATWGLLAAETLFGVLAYTALTLAIQTGEISVVAPFRYLRLLVALLFAYFLFGERPDLWTLAGAVLIVGSGIYTLLRSGRVASPPPPTRP
ncbi:DMT family transporter [Pseudooceanicola algae]|uniref:DMT family transporter n=1 Tax=Pseudooceanicola algae TaxID=1537215 RepID=UPI001E51D1F2|nr:DMT family transporter [Pseudooceanicola algae]